MNGERAQMLQDILEQTAADLEALSLTADTLCMGLEREITEPQAAAALRIIVMDLSYIRQNINSALKTEQKTQ